MFASQYGVQDALLSSLQLMNNLDLSTDADAKLSRSQGVMWALTCQSEVLRRSLMGGDASFEPSGT